MARRRGASSLTSLQAATLPNADPLGIDVQTRGLAAERQARQDMADRSFDEQNPLLATSAITGPLPDARWAGFFQALADQGVHKLGGGPSPAGSNQLTGTSVQPDWLPTTGLAPGVSPTGTATDALDALRRRTTPLRPPMVDDAGRPAPPDDATTTAPQPPPAPTPPPKPNPADRYTVSGATTATNNFVPFRPNPTPQPSVRSTMSDVLSTIRKKNPR
jgi:hypothetical protein